MTTFLDIGDLRFPPPVGATIRSSEPGAEGWMIGEWPSIVPVGGKLWELRTEYSVEWPTSDKRRLWLLIEVGFTTDLSSVPRFLWPLIPPWGLRQACLPHDAAYRCGGWLPPGCHLYQAEYVDGTLTRWADITNKERLERRNVDRHFGAMMRLLGVPRWKRRPAYLYVRTVGWIPWSRAARTWPDPPG